MLARHSKDLAPLADLDFMMFVTRYFGKANLYISKLNKGDKMAAIPDLPSPQQAEHPGDPLRLHQAAFAPDKI